MTTPPPSFSRRRLIAAGATTAASASLLAGCGTTQEGPDASKVNPTGPPLELGPELPVPKIRPGYIGPRATEQKPFADGSQTFRVVVPQDAATVGDWNTNKASAWIAEKTGMKIDFQAVLTVGADGKIDMTKINAMIASDDLPDAFMGLPFSPAQLSQYGQQGIFLPLDKLIEVYAPRTRAAMADYPALKGMSTATDGKMYLIPGINDCFHCRSSPGRAWISQNYLAKVGLDMPTTTAELREVLVAFKRSNPSGKPGFLPLAATSTDQLDAYFMQPFLYNPSYVENVFPRPGWLAVENDKVVFVAHTDPWREALRYLRQLGDDGVLTEQTFTMTRSELQTAGNKLLVGFARTYFWGYFFNPLTKDLNAPWRDYVAVPPVKGPAGVQTANWDYYQFAINGLQITRKCSEPALMVQWADFQKDLMSAMTLTSGVQNENWSWAAEGTKGISGQQALYADKASPAPLGTSWLKYATDYRSNDFRLSQQVDPKAPQSEVELYQAGKTYEKYAQPREKQLPPLILPDSDAATTATIASATRQAVTRGIVDFSLGRKDINNDADWRAYVDAFTAMNLQSYLDIYQKAFDARPK